MPGQALGRSALVESIQPICTRRLPGASLKLGAP
jgi:hypothetical protein